MVFLIVIAGTRIFLVVINDNQICKYWKNSKKVYLNMYCKVVNDFTMYKVLCHDGGIMVIIKESSNSTKNMSILDQFILKSKKLF